MRKTRDLEKNGEMKKIQYGSQYKLVDGEAFEGNLHVAKNQECPYVKTNKQTNKQM